MTVKIAFLPDEIRGRVSASADETDGNWARVRDAVLQIEPSAEFVGRSVDVDWRIVTAAATEFANLRARLGVTFEYDDAARNQLLRFRDEVREVAQIRGSAATELSERAVDERLLERGFTRRTLKEHQQSVVLRLASMRNGANFSVPGAGKTTVALAVHLLTAPVGSAMVVVSPKNAFAAWDEVLEDCLAPGYRSFERISGSAETVRNSLHEAGTGARILMTYDQLRTTWREVAAYMRQHRTHLILDESHRIKAGRDSQQGQAALALAHLAIRKDILSGTPVPNGIQDLSPQLEFLWPSQGLPQQVQAAPRPRDVIGPFYVRTTKRQLGLGPVIKHYLPVPMSDAQVVLYSLTKDELLKVETGIRSRAPNVDLDGARRSVLTLLQISSNPILYVNRVTGDNPERFIHDNEVIAATFSAVYEERDSPKVLQACRLARDLADRGQRSVIWSTFTHNVERVATLLADLGATYIHGGVDTGDANDPDTREGRIRQFHDHNMRSMVLVANPAACSEGISLHKVCHNAIYLDRSFNAGHFLQSIDRIHRLGLDPDIDTHVHILESVSPQLFGSVDFSVRRRMIAKLRDMNAVLEDEDLQALLLDESSADAPYDYDIMREDIVDVIDQLRGLAPEPGEEPL